MLQFIIFALLIVSRASARPSHSLEHDLSVDEPVHSVDEQLYGNDEAEHANHIHNHDDIHQHEDVLVFVDENNAVERERSMNFEEEILSSSSESLEISADIPAAAAGEEHDLAFAALEETPEEDKAEEDLVDQFVPRNEPVELVEESEETFEAPEVEPVASAEVPVDNLDVQLDNFVARSEQQVNSEVSEDIPEVKEAIIEPVPRFETVDPVVNSEIVPLDEELVQIVDKTSRNEPGYLGEVTKEDVEEEPIEDPLDNFVPRSEQIVNLKVSEEVPEVQAEIVEPVLKLDLADHMVISEEVPEVQAEIVEPVLKLDLADHMVISENVPVVEEAVQTVEKTSRNEPVYSAEVTKEATEYISIKDQLDSFDSRSEQIVNLEVSEDVPEVQEEIVEPVPRNELEDQELLSEDVPTAIARNEYVPDKEVQAENIEVEVVQKSSRNEQVYPVADVVEPVQDGQSAPNELIHVEMSEGGDE